jgi:eukaryotic translation initiation factor 2C
MYVGIDLSHAAPGSRRKRSAVAVVASVDDIPIRYLKEIYIQERPAKEQGQGWEYIVAIVIYRDGISTSEFDTIFEKELTATREACIELSPAYRPYLTYIVVNKRHHTRFFPENSKDNVEAGTVVDSHDVTNPTTYDFFLNSHHGAKVNKMILLSSMI